MKSNLLFRVAAGSAAAALTVSLAGCGATADSTASSETTAASSETAETSEMETAESADDAYAYLADFSLSDGFDENGYLAGVTATDYVTLPEEYQNLTIDADTATVTDEEINDYISQNILVNYQTTQEVTDRAAQEGDTVNIDYAGTMDGVAFDGGTATGYDLVLGSGTFIDGFEDQIVGHMPGYTFDVEVTFPESYPANPDLAGKPAVFATTLNSISETVTPELTDEWVSTNLKDALGLETVDALKTYVKDSMVYSQQANAIYSQLVENSTFAEELPAELVEYYNNQNLYTAYQYSQMYGISMSDLLSASGFDSVDAYLEAANSYMESTAHQTLIMQALAEKLGMVCDTETMNAEFPRLYSSNDIASFVDSYGENYIKMNILDQLVMEKLIDNATLA